MDYNVFLSYRRADSAGHAGRICDDLERHYGRPVAFRDVDSIAAGRDFVSALEQAIAGAKVAIVLMGDDWLGVANAAGERRLDDPQDHVRREVEMALQDKDVTVVPVLVDGAVMPNAEALPEPLQALARLQAIALSEDRWDYDVTRLIKVLEGAGVTRGPIGEVPVWAKATIAGLLAAALALAAWCWWPSAPDADDYAGLWYLPNGSYWTVRVKDDGTLWVEETHHDSQQVWKQGPADLDGDVLSVDLDLVFDRVDYRYRHRLRLAEDRHSLIGSVGRSNQAGESSLVLSRERH